MGIPNIFIGDSLARTGKQGIDDWKIYKGDIINHTRTYEELLSKRKKEEDDLKLNQMRTELAHDAHSS